MKKVISLSTDVSTWLLIKVLLFQKCPNETQILEDIEPFESDEFGHLENW